MATLTEKDKALLEKYLNKTSNENRCAQKGKKVQIVKTTIRQFALLLLDAQTV